MRSTQIIIVMVTDFLFRLIARVGVFRLCQVYIWVAASVQEASRSSDLEIQAVAPAPLAAPAVLLPSLLKSFYLHNSWKTLNLTSHVNSECPSWVQKYLWISESNLKTKVK